MRARIYGYFAFNSTEPRLGCGHRRVIAFNAGRKWITLLNPNTLRHAKVERPAFDRLAERCETPLARLARRLDDRRRYFQRLNRAAKAECPDPRAFRRPCPFAAATVKAVIAALRNGG